MASQSTYLSYANAAAEVLTTQWFPANGPLQWVNQYYDFWRTPNAMTALLRLSQLTGADYSATAANVRAAFFIYFDPNAQPAARYLPAYYDDEAWWASCFLRLYAMTKDTSWSTTAAEVFADLAYGWDDTAKGGVWWMRNPRSYPSNNKGGVTNELYMEVGMTLYGLGGESAAQYLAATNQTWQWLQLLRDSSNLIWGNLNEDATIYPSNVPRPYTQGVILAPLWDLYVQSNDTSYLDAAQAIAEAAITNMVWPDGILQEICEKQGNCTPTETNPSLFKGIYVRHLGEFAVKLATVDDPARQQAAASYAAFLQKNADALYANYPGGTYGMDWHTAQPNYTPTGVAIWDACLQVSALDLFVSAAIVSQ